jgi:hypothetical protein
LASVPTCNARPATGKAAVRLFLQRKTGLLPTRKPPGYTTKAMLEAYREAISFFPDDLYLIPAVVGKKADYSYNLLPLAPS